MTPSKQRADTLGRYQIARKGSDLIHGQARQRATHIPVVSCRQKHFVHCVKVERYAQS